MGFITISSVTLLPAPTETKIVTIKHRLTSAPDIDGSYTTDSTVINVNTSGVLVDGVGTPSPFTITGLANGTSYTIKISSNCGGASAQGVFVTNCICNAGFTSVYSNTLCEKIEVDDTKLTTYSSNNCLAAKGHSTFATLKSRIYNTGFDVASIQLDNAPAGDVFAEMTLASQWRNDTGSAVLGPMNRDSVWLDSNCDGTADNLVSRRFTIPFYFLNSSGAERTVYVGFGAKHGIVLSRNGQTIVSSPFFTNVDIFHIVPVVLKKGKNDFNLYCANGFDLADSAAAMVIYDNTPAQIRDATSDAGLTILFRSSTLVSSSINAASCANGWALETIGGLGSYHCRIVTSEDCQAPN